MASSERSVFLTFDDGPTPGVTDTLLDILDQYQAKATFFCLGASAELAPKLVDEIVRRGHGIGNHTYSHLSGWATATDRYFDDIARCDTVLNRAYSTRLIPFRPPFGKLGIIQGLRLVRQRKVVMWEVNAMDYRPDQNASLIAARVCQTVRPGSIVLFHDSLEAGLKTIEALPSILKTLSQKGFRFEAIGA